ncbi:MAG: hypothetical protein ACTSO9_16465, partial [Candidatus Helarchaeota archaeon]
MPMKLREILNKIKWDPQLKGKNYQISFIHRGIPGNRKTIESKNIDKISSNFFSYIESDNIT